MSILRAMTYALNEPAMDVELVAQVIRSQRPDLVFVQNLQEDPLKLLALKTGLSAGCAGGNSGFLSRHPLSVLQLCDLGESGGCLRADLDLEGKRIHLFNLQLACDPARRGQQLAKLFDVDLLGASLPCATLVGGDFSIPLWGGGQWLLRRKLKPTGHPGWGGNYPSFLPLWPRDRFYLRGPLRSLAGQVVKTPDARKVSNHLPVITTLELTDTRIYLKVPEVSESRMRPATG